MLCGGILASLKTTCCRTTGSYFLISSLFFWVRLFFVRVVRVAGAGGRKEADVLAHGERGGSTGQRGPASRTREKPDP